MALSGVEYYALGMTRALLDHDEGNDYVVFTNLPIFVQEYLKPRRNLSIVPVKWIRNRGQRILWEHLWLPRLAVQHSLDLLHCPSYVCPVFGGRIPYVVTVHDTIAIDRPSWCTLSNALYYNTVMRAGLRRASAIVSVSEQTARDIRRLLPECEEKTQVVYPGVDDCFRFGNDPSRYAQVRLQYNLPNRYILYVGNLEPKKNLLTLIRAFRLLHEWGRPHKLVLVGQRSWKTASFRQEIAKASIAGQIILTGYVDRKDLPTVYELADVFACVSLHEGFGFPPLEAMACGTPVVSSHQGALRETLGDAAIIVNPYDPQNIAHGIDRLLVDTQESECRRQMGFEQCRHFRWSSFAERMLSIYPQVIR